MSLHGFLTRLILWCVAPLVLLAAYLGFDSVHRAHTERNREAASLARNYATAIDESLNARIAALRMLAASPLADEPTTWNILYEEALEFRRSFHSDVIIANPDGTRRFDTRQSFGMELPRFVQPNGVAAMTAAMETGKPAVSNVFTSALTAEELIAVAVPGVREGKVAFVVLNAVHTLQFQEHLAQVALPPGMTLSLIGGNGRTIARRGAAQTQESEDFDPDGRFSARSNLADWTVVLEIPRELYRAPLLAAALAVALAIAATTLIAIVGGLLASRRLGAAVASLAAPPSQSPPETGIEEITAARLTLDESERERIAAEEARRKSELRFRATFEQAAVGIALLGTDGRWLLVNQKLCDILGYDATALCGLTLKDILHPEELEGDGIWLARMLAGEIDTFAAEKRYLRKDGSTVWVNFTVALVRSPDGRPDYFVSVIEDIARRKRAEAELQLREGALKEAQRLARLGSWRWNCRSRQQTWSEETYRILGFDPASAPAPESVLRTCYVSDSWARIEAAMEEAMRRGTPVSCDAELLGSDGERRWVLVRGEVDFDSEGEIVELHGTIQDISERKNAADALHELNTHLEQRVQQRTAELSAANRELDAFAYTVSHDLRAPLRALSGFSQALLEDFGNELHGDAKAYLDHIGLASRKMSELIEGILALSRVTRGELRHERVDVSALAAETLADLRLAQAEREVATEVEPGLVADGDPRMIQVLLRNLLENAWKYTGRTAGACIRVHRGEIDGLEGICISDNGAGFDMSHTAQLFEPFRRLHREDEFPGIGIGLATVQRIVHRHGGSIRARSAAGEGACFCFTFAQEPADK